MSAVTVICAADDRYALPLAVMLESLSAHADPAQLIEVYIIDCGLSAPRRARIETRARPNLRFHWRPSMRLPELGSPRWGHVSAATFDRLLIERYLPSTTARVLWLDCDLLVLDDITPLFSLPMNDSTLLAVPDPFIRTLGSPFGVQHWRDLGLPGDEAYFNAGVMLIDMVRWRATQVTSRAIDHVSRYRKELFFNEQEALNAVVAGQWAPLADRWNYSANRFHAKRQSLGCEQPAIIHFAGRVKPWNLPDLGPAQELFFTHLDKTAWCGARPNRTARNRLVSWYTRSRLRELTYPLENLYLRLSHYLGI
ncbi:MAG TPA: glycosyltransferase family 8 protein [Xanthomonadales bacterium]|nr:glycosyltransferase family 8 protein [Xanthomonadales bacterium]